MIKNFSKDQSQVKHESVFKIDFLSLTTFPGCFYLWSICDAPYKALLQCALKNIYTYIHVTANYLCGPLI